MNTRDLPSETFLATSLTAEPRAALIVVAALVAGLQAGTYFTWSTGVMPGLARVDDRTFVDAMQQINIAIVNPLFLATFLGAPVLAGAAALLGGPSARPWAIAATALAIGTLVITFAGNIPLNDTLDAVDPHAADAAARWSDYYASWMPLNAVRAATGIAASGLLANALRVG